MGLASRGKTLRRSLLHELFCTTTNLTPEVTHEGKLLLIDMNVKQWHGVGTLAQKIWKYAWQRATEIRDVKQNPLPCFIWIDESQHFLLRKQDMLFQTTARSARACTVLLSQNINNYYAALGGKVKGAADTDSLLGNLQTKIFHANGCAVTNKWAAETCAQTWQTRTDINIGRSQTSRDFVRGDWSDQAGAHVTHHMHWQILPHDFTTLRKGGPDNQLQVDAIVFQGGRVFKSTGKNHVRVYFKQDD